MGPLGNAGSDKFLDRRECLTKSALISATLLAFNPFHLASAETYAPNETAPDILWQVNRAEDPRNLRGVELGHVPQLKAPDTVKAGEPFEVGIIVGKNLHEMVPVHYIDWIDLYAGEIFLYKIILTPNFTQPISTVTLTLKTSTTLKAIEHCNVHGLWEGTKRITVT